jgi:hypothetical protein
MITLDQLDTTDLRAINEIWLGESATDTGGNELCLWRAEQVFTHDMLSEGTHDQNTRRLTLELPSLDDRTAVAAVEAKVRELLEKSSMTGDFYPAEGTDTRTLP